MGRLAPETRSSIAFNLANLELEWLSGTRAIADRLTAEVNRAPDALEAERETALVETLRPVITGPSRVRATNFHSGRVALRGDRMRG
jgi:hypothetical protein